MLKECIILAGGLGTRLQSTVPDTPKCMAPVAGRPFLFYVINYLRSQGIEKFIFSLGYLHEQIEAYLEKEFGTLSYSCSIEEEPLGTGGAILLACQQTTEKEVLVVNGDTLFSGNFQDAFQFHTRHLAECTLLLKPMKEFDRYGVVETGEDQLVRSFKEKQYYQQGNINAGVYILNVARFQDEEFPSRFSFEKDYLEKYYPRRRIYGLVQDYYFIDIGIPEDFRRANLELVKPDLNLKAIDKNWSLFLDRDGVINEDKPGSYIFNAAEFVFMEGAPALFKKLTDIFGHILVVTNQRGVGKGLMTVADLEDIHAIMIAGIQGAGGKVDAIYYAPSLDNKDPFRKPNPGMAFKARRDFSGIDLHRAIMVGNKMSDMGFGRNAGMYTVYIASTNPEAPFPHPDVDLRYKSLLEFANSL
ncbi:MAG: HAD-IIIA family hydrolase [Chitinophagaceae bacterium]|nr:HAD-IIIA family hydrolase [Chitinophagaceae bacterium]